MPGSSRSKDVSGWLSMWSNTLGRYEKTWLVLSNGILALHKTDGFELPIMTTAISLGGAAIDFDESCKLAVCRDGDVWHFRAEDVDDKQRWVEALSAAATTMKDGITSNVIYAGSELHGPSSIFQVEQSASKICFNENRMNETADPYNVVSPSTSEGVQTSAALDNRVPNRNDNQCLHAIYGKDPIQENTFTVGSILYQTRSCDLKLTNELQNTASRMSHVVRDKTIVNGSEASVDVSQTRRIDPIGWGSVSLNDEHMTAIEQNFVYIEKCYDCFAESYTSLQQSITAMENSPISCVLQEILERAETCQHKALALREACANYKGIAELQNKEWKTLYQSEHEEKVKLERIVETLTQAQSKSNYVSSEDDRSFEFPGCPQLNSESVGTGRSIINVQVYQASQIEGSGPIKWRRSRIPDRPNVSDSLWTILKNCIGTDLSKMPLPVSFAEPLSLLQRLTEDFEYSRVLDEASECGDNATQLAYVAAFIASSYSTTISRTGKPFNPLLGETYECDRLQDLGWRSIAEQVSHHPPVAALYCEGRNWTLWMDQSLKMKFKGTTLTITPIGECHLNFKNGNRYSWKKPNTIIHNVIVGKLWVEQEGDVDITCATNSFQAKLTFVQSGWTGENFSVRGVVKHDQKPILDIVGKYSTQIEYRPTGSKETGTVIWKRTEPPLDNAKYYNFTLLACQLNEKECDTAPTDSRLRPDQRLMEDGNFDGANIMKRKLEEHQRINRKAAWEPCWFKRKTDADTKTNVWTYGGEYWSCKASKDWSRCPAQIFTPSETSHHGNTEALVVNP